MVPFVPSSDARYRYCRLPSLLRKGKPSPPLLPWVLISTVAPLKRSAMWYAKSSTAPVVAVPAVSLTHTRRPAMAAVRRGVLAVPELVATSTIRLSVPLIGKDAIGDRHPHPRAGWDIHRDAEGHRVRDGRRRAGVVAREGGGKRRERRVAQLQRVGVATRARCGVELEGDTRYRSGAIDFGRQIHILDSGFLGCGIAKRPKIADCTAE